MKFVTYFYLLFCCQNAELYGQICFVLSFESLPRTLLLLTILVSCTSYHILCAERKQINCTVAVHVQVEPVRFCEMLVCFGNTYIP